MPGRLENLSKATVRLQDGSLVPVELESAWPHKDLWVLKFSSIDCIDDAERFRGTELCVAVEQRGQLADGEYFQSDLIGCEVIEGSSRRVLGKVERWQQYGGPPLIELQVDGREVLIPFVPAICREVDIAGKRIVVDLPEGLFDM